MADVVERHSGREHNSKAPGEGEKRKQGNTEPTPQLNGLGAPKPIGVVAYKNVLVLMVLGAVMGIGFWGMSIWAQSAGRRRALYTQTLALLSFALNRAQEQCLAEATLLANNPRVVEALGQANREAIKAAIAPVLETLSCHRNIKIQVYRPPAIALWRSWSSHSGDDVSSCRKTVVEAIAKQGSVLAIEGDRVGIALRAVVPVRSPSGHVIGAVESLRELDDAIVHISTELKMPVAYVISPQFAKVDRPTPAVVPSYPTDDVANSGRWLGNVFVASFPRHLAAKIEAHKGGALPHVMWAGGRIYVVAALPLRDFRQGHIGHIVAAQDITVPELQVWGTLALSLAGAFLTFLLIIATMIRNSRFLMDRTHRITEALDRLVKGEIAIPLPKPPTLECATHMAKLEQLKEELQRRQTRIQDMWQCQDLMSHARDEEELCEIAWYYAHKAGVELLEVFRIDNSRAHVRRIMRMTTGLGDGDQNWHTPEQCRAFRKGAIYSVADTSSEMGCPICPGPAEHCYICIPLISNGVMLGLMRCAWSQPHELSDDTRQLLLSYANLLSVSLDNAYLVKQLREATLRDPLTGLYNRRFLEEYLMRLSAQLQRNPEPVTVLMADLDFFKRINDEYGHEAGDMVLRMTASTLQSCLREGDILCRYGGEEIAAVLSNCSIEAAEKLAERMRRAVEAQRVLLPDRMDPVRVTISVGIACYPEHSSKLLDLLHLADRALYIAKQSGRNRCMVWAEAAEKDAA